MVTDESLWRLLRSHRFTTPLLRQWVPWLSQEMQKKGDIVRLTQSGCDAALMLADDETLDELVKQGLKQRHLTVNGQPSGLSKLNGNAWSSQIRTLEEYLLAYGPLLGKQAERSLHPLHVPGQDSLPDLDLLRSPFEAQSHVIEAVRKSL
ncbi:hypothetical protein FRUB_10090 [Fimbriiglobus ruber]|uniref:Uncharacterized protein n=1 Tax=Fimbriiglobus ruber TaxID=1908690 RepID=A0A225DAG2_9BACT|nr:hypothetical protein FRUB_10090 [Fimbriiglobus ruber]